MQIKFLVLLTLLLYFFKCRWQTVYNLQRILVAISSCKIPVVNHDKILPVGISFNSKCVVLTDDMFARKDSRQAVVWLTEKNYKWKIIAVTQHNLKWLRNRAWKIFRLQRNRNPWPLRNQWRSDTNVVFEFFFCNYITGVAYTTAIIFHFFTFLPQ